MLPALNLAANICVPLSSHHRPVGRVPAPIQLAAGGARGVFLGLPGGVNYVATVFARNAAGRVSAAPAYSTLVFGSIPLLQPSLCIPLSPLSM